VLEYSPSSLSLPCSPSSPPFLLGYFLFPSFFFLEFHPELLLRLFDPLLGYCFFFSFFSVSRDCQRIFFHLRHLGLAGAVPRRFPASTFSVSPEQGKELSDFLPPRRTTIIPFFSLLPVFIPECTPSPCVGPVPKVAFFSLCFFFELSRLPFFLSWTTRPLQDLSALPRLAAVFQRKRSPPDPSSNPHFIFFCFAVVRTSTVRGCPDNTDMFLPSPCKSSIGALLCPQVTVAVRV